MANLTRMAEPSAAPSPQRGGLVLAATPIGDPDDATPRLRALLADADLIAAEDTRRLHRLLGALGVEPRGRIVSYHEHNEASRTAQLVDAVREGRLVLLVTDAGMPSVSDPGLRAVRAVADAGLPVTVAPGPSAVLAALALSGLATDRFCFEGFLSRKDGERRRALAALADEPRTLVFFEAPHRLQTTLRAMVEAFGRDRPAAVCRELTKTYEEVRRGGLHDLLIWAEGEVRGEITVVVAGKPPIDPSTVDLDGVARVVRERSDAGERLKDVVAELAAAHGVNKRALYDASVRV
jgi:16S rRNA (cytidine1402-2'-O)-methyltransferase